MFLHMFTTWLFQTFAATVQLKNNIREETGYWMSIFLNIHIDAMIA